MSLLVTRCLQTKHHFQEPYLQLGMGQYHIFADTPILAFADTADTADTDTNG